MEGMDGVVRFDILGGPGRFRLRLDRLLGRPTRFRIATASEYHHLQVLAVLPLLGRPGVVSILGGRLFGEGRVIVMWGEYNLRTRTGQLWIQQIPDVHTAWYSGPTARAAQDRLLGGWRGMRTT